MRADSITPRWVPVRLPLWVTHKRDNYMFSPSVHGTDRYFQKGNDHKCAGSWQGQDFDTAADIYQAYFVCVCMCVCVKPI